MDYRPLGKTGMQVSVIGYGASPLGNEFGEADFDECVRAVQLAIDSGITLFDVSPYYGRTLAEERLGRALQGRRDKVILATKCGRYGKTIEQCDYSAARVTASIDESLQRLRTDYVDLFQVHDVEMVDDPDRIVNETVPALRKLQEAGKCRAVGITGLPLKILRYIASRVPVDTLLSFCRYNLMVDDMNRELTSFCIDQRIGLINASPLHMRMLTREGPPDWHPAPAEVKEAGRRVVELCRQANVDPADVSLRFCLDHPYVSSTLVGMSTSEHVKNNLRALRFETPPALRQKIEQTVAPVKNVMWMQGRPENNDQNWSRG
jgi:aryl-alcohol dehydrogenase-like predicted oxidoreductase